MLWELKIYYKSPDCIGAVPEITQPHISKPYKTETINTLRCHYRGKWENMLFWNLVESFFNHLFHLLHLYPFFTCLASFCSLVLYFYIAPSRLNDGKISLLPSYHPFIFFRQRKLNSLAIYIFLCFNLYVGCLKGDRPSFQCERNEFAGKDCWFLSSFVGELLYRVSFFHKNYRPFLPWGSVMSCPDSLMF